MHYVIICRCMGNPRPCHGAVRCHNTAGDGVSFACDPCPEGYTGDGMTCTDVDEVIMIVIMTQYLYSAIYRIVLRCCEHAVSDTK